MQSTLFLSSRTYTARLALVFPAIFAGMLFMAFHPAAVLADEPDEAKTQSVESNRNTGFGGFAIPGFTRREEAASENPAPEVPRAPLEEMIPEHALLVVRTASLDVLNQKGQYFLTQLGLGSVAPLDWIRLSPFGKCVPHVDLKQQAAVVYVPYGHLMARVVIIPVKNYRQFVLALGANPETLPSPLSEGFVSVVKNPANHHVFLKKGYAVIAEPVPLEVMDALWTAQPLSKKHALTPSGTKQSHLSLEVTRNGLEHLIELAGIAMEDFSPVFSEAMKSLNIPDPELDMAEEYFIRAREATQWMESNLDGVRMDMFIQKNLTLTSMTFRPRAGSPFMAQMQDKSGPAVFTTLDKDNFLKIVPDAPAPMAGQIDVTPDVASRMAPPFDRVRHAEFMLGLPAPGQLLAERWCFFLEVEDAQSFVAEMIIPKAQLVGSHIGASTMGDIGAKVGENLANIRASRQQRRAAMNRPINRPLADPQAAAQRGAELGARLGSAFGRDAGEKEAMKVYNFDGYPLYISDVALYAREMKKIRAEEAGDFSHRGVDGDFRLINVVQRSVVGLQTGNLQNSFQDVIQQFMDREAPGGDGPLLATRNLVLILDDSHILIVPGSEDVLRTAKNNWEKVRHLYTPTGAAPKPAIPPASAQRLTPGKSILVGGGKLPRLTWHDSWNIMRGEVAHPEKNIMRTAMLFDGVNVQYFCDNVRRNYAPALPQPFSSPLPADAPAALAVTTVAGDTGHLFFGFPHDLSKNLLQIYMKRMAGKEQ